MRLSRGAAKIVKTANKAAKRLTEMEDKRGLEVLRAHDWLVGRLEEFGITVDAAVSNFYIKDVMGEEGDVKVLSLNQLKCMLRRDMIESGMASDNGLNSKDIEAILLSFFARIKHELTLIGKDSADYPDLYRQYTIKGEA
jgi:hypothetical protein